jgi:hypothetical protein
VIIGCRRCGYLDDVEQAPAPGATCQTCGTGLFRKKTGTPRPSTHAGALLSSIFSGRGVAFLVVFAVIAGFAAFSGRLLILTSVLLFLAATKLAVKAMLVEKGRIEFPEVSPEELFDVGALLPIAIYVIVFVWGPPLLGLTLVASGEVPAVVAGSVALVLFLYSPMALVLHLRTKSSWGFFAVFPGIRLIARSPRAYLSLIGLVGSAMIARYAIDAASAVSFSSLSLLLFVALHAAKAVAVLMAFGLCGLYIRDQARVLDFPCDDDDWVPLAKPEEIVHGFPASARHGSATERTMGDRPRGHHAPIALGADDTDVPVVQGQMLDEGKRLESGPDVVVGQPLEGSVRARSRRGS